MDLLVHWVYYFIGLLLFGQLFIGLVFHYFIGPLGLLKRTVSYLRSLLKPTTGNLSMLELRFTKIYVFEKH